MSQPTRTDSAQDVREYKARLLQLYKDVEAWLGSRYQLQRVTGSDVLLNEEATGPYRTKSLDIALDGLPAIRLVPRGIFMVGARGQVDVRSRLGSETLVWVINEEVNGSADKSLSRVSRNLFTQVEDGWAWVDHANANLRHLTQAVFLDQVVESLVR